VANSFGGQAGTGGGGAVLVAVADVLTVDGAILARSGQAQVSTWSGAGAGGSIRLIANLFEGSGILDARHIGGWWAGSVGLIRVESFEMFTFPFGNSFPAFTWETTATPIILWPPENAPKVEITRVTGPDMSPYDVPTEPIGRMDINADLQIQTLDAVTVEIAATDVPLDATVELRVTPTNAHVRLIPAIFVSGDATASMWEATFVPDPNASAVQAPCQPGGRRTMSGDPRDSQETRR
jgi:hypothetical protein